MPAPYCYPYPRPMVTVDLVVFALADDGLRTLFIKRKKDPFAGFWAIPGGYLEMEETVRDAACRELKEETGLDGLSHVEPIGIFDAIGRDPRGRTISVAHAAVIRGPLPEVAGGDDAKAAEWLDPSKVERLAFDHDKILARAREWLAQSLDREEILFRLLAETFGKDEIGTLLKATGGKQASPARWLASHRRAGRIQEIADSPGRFNSSPRDPLR